MNTFLMARFIMNFQVSLMHKDYHKYSQSIQNLLIMEEGVFAQVLGTVVEKDSKNLLKNFIWKLEDEIIKANGKNKFIIKNKNGVEDE